MLRHQHIVDELPRLRRYAHALTRDAARADDLVQDTVERALSRFMLWRPGKLRAWLFTIMHNLYINQARTASQLEYRDAEALPELPVRASQTDALEMRDLVRALARLPIEQREVLLLIGLEDLSYEDAAKIIGVPIGTVMSRLARGRERLRALLARGELPEPQLKVIK